MRRAAVFWTFCIEWRTELGNWEGNWEGNCHNLVQTIHKSFKRHYHFFFFLLLPSFPPSFLPSVSYFFLHFVITTSSFSYFFFAPFRHYCLFLFFLLLSFLPPLPLLFDPLPSTRHYHFFFFLPSVSYFFLRFVITASSFSHFFLPYFLHYRLTGSREGTSASAAWIIIHLPHLVTQHWTSSQPETHDEAETHSVKSQLKVSVVSQVS